MAPRNFSDDGAAGAFGGGASSGPDAVTMHDPGPGSPEAANTTPPSTTASTFKGVGAGYGMNPANIGAYQKALSMAGQPSTAQFTAGGEQLKPGDSGYQMFFQPPAGVDNIYFADGGPVPGDSDPSAMGAGGADYSDLVGQALTAVDAALQYGRNKYGIGSDESDGAGRQYAAAMPAAPGTQSPGAPQPAPGPLVPTANPFGKRQGQPFGRVAENDSEDGESEGAIPDEEGETT